VAYESNESGQREIYVRTFVSDGTRAGKWQVSSGGGTQPVWSRRGRELFFVTGDRLMVTEYQNVGGTFIASKPRVWATLPRIGNTGFSRYDVTPDGRRVVLLTRAQPEAGGRAPQMHLLLNFFDEIRRRSPAN
jgi:hypothetical protein